MRGANDNPDNAGAPVFVASWLALSIPMIVVAVGYGAMLVWLAFTGQSGTSLARICRLALTFGVPVLAGHALLRMATIRVRPKKNAVSVHAGFPRSRAIEVPYGLIEEVSARRGPLGRLVSSGTLVLTLVDGGRLSVSDLADPSRVAQAVRDARENSRNGSAPSDSARIGGHAAMMTGA